MPKLKVKKIKDSVPVEKVAYYADAEAVCSCGAKFNMGSTQKSIKVEVCSNCHPFYTGTQKLVDTSGRLDKFKARLAKKKEMDSKMVKKTKTVKVEPKKDEQKKGDK